MKHTRTVLATLLAAAFLCMSVFAFTPETVETPAEPTLADGKAALTEVTSELLFYQDFDHLPVGTYDSGAIASMLTGTEGAKIVDFANQGWGVLGAGCSFEICEEENGNRYLKVTGNTYNAFGVWFENDEQHYAVMSFNYKFPAATGYKGLNEAAYEKKGTMRVGGSTSNNTGNWDASGALTNAAATEWTQHRGHSYVKSPCLGFGFNSAGEEGVVYLDDLAVWSFSTKIDDGAEPAHTSQVKKTVSFKNSTGSADAEMPADITRYAWYNFYNGQWVQVTVNLNSFVPATVPAGYEFAGWSASDGGTKIKDCHYSDFKVPGDFTFYAIWKKAKPAAEFEDFERFEVGTELTNDDLSFLQLNQFGVGNFSATVVLDETTNSKVLKLAGNQYAGFALKNRGSSALDCPEYVSFDYRYDSEDGSRLHAYAGNDHTGSQLPLIPKEAPRNTAWERTIQGSSTGKNVFGYFFESRDGNYTIYLDNFYYWYAPADSNDADKNVTITFANSTTGLHPGTVTMPKPITKKLWENESTGENTIDLNSIVPTSYTTGYRFVGWSRTDGGKMISTKYNNYLTIKDETLYAVWAELETPEILDTVSIRTAGVQGMRFKATVHNSLTQYDTAELGFLVTRGAVYDTLEMESDFSFEMLGDDSSSLVSGIAYKKADGTVMLDKLSQDPEAGAYAAFTAVLVGIPESKENYTEQIYIRAYMSFGGNTFYGEIKHMSLYEAALAVKAAEGYEPTEFVEKIIEVCK